MFLYYEMGALIVYIYIYIYIYIYTWNLVKVYHFNKPIYSLVYVIHCRRWVQAQGNSIIESKTYNHYISYQICLYELFERNSFNPDTFVMRISIYHVSDCRKYQIVRIIYSLCMILSSETSWYSYCLQNKTFTKQIWTQSCVSFVHARLICARYLTH